MAAVCEKDFALHVAPPGGLVEYWKLDAGPPYPAEINTPSLDFTTLLATPLLGVGIRNAAMQISPQAVLNGEGVTTDQTGNPLIKINSGFTFTTWGEWSSFGDPATSSNLLEIYFLDSAGAEVINFKVTMLGGAPPQFVVIEKNSSSFFSPTPSFSVGSWYFFHIRFDFSSKKIGFQRGVLPFGLSSIQESIAVVEDLSSITKGYLVLRSVRNAAPTSASYNQDESGFWTRLLTSAEIDQMWNSGTAAIYPAIPQ